MNPQDLPRKLAQRLEEGLDSLAPGVAFRLRAARETALARARGSETVVERSAVGVLAGLEEADGIQSMLTELGGVSEAHTVDDEALEVVASAAAPGRCLS